MHRPYNSGLLEHIPPLENGDRLTRDEFERRYQAMPAGLKAELLEGVVYMPSPQRFRSHGKPSRYLSGWLYSYEVATPGVEGADNATIRLDLDSEPQPDALLLISPDHGGQSQVDEDDYIVGAPELSAEAAASSVSYDLHVKLPVFRRNGVKEYLVWRVLDAQVDWFSLQHSDYVRLEPDEQGILRSLVFPGLWLDVPALVRFDGRQVLEVLRQGLATPEHAEFVSRLAEAAKTTEA